MSDALQLDDVIAVNVIELHDAPKLLIEWASPWEEFVTSIRPAFTRSPARLAGEAPHGIFPYRGILTSWALEILLLLAVIFLPAKLARLRPYVPSKPPTYEVIYYSGDELPQTKDLGGAQAGASGRAGGKEAHHDTQTIRVARGGSLTSKIVDAPNLKLPASMSAVANLLAIKPNPGPPPAEGLHSSLTAPTLPASVVGPAPANVMRDRSRTGVSLNNVIPPAPNVSRDRALASPSLNAGVIPPAPSVLRDRTLVAPDLTSRIIAPAPSNVSRGAGRSAPNLNGSMIPPAPSAVAREGSRSPVQMANSSVIPPPVSAPERETSRNSKLSLPAPSVIAPPSSAGVTRDLHSMGSNGAVDPSKAVIPPPAQVASGGFMSSILGKLLGTTDVVPPAPNASATGIAGSSGRSPGGAAGSLTSNVVAPPPSLGGSGTSGNRARGGAGSSTLGTAIVPPPPSVTGSGTGRINGTAGGASNGGGTVLGSNVVPPPPSMGGGSGLSGSGRGAKGLGFGGPLDAGSVAAPPNGGGASGGGSGVVLSSQPGSNVGKPAGGTAGSLALSPAGGNQPGVGGSGGGSGIGHGDGPGSGLTGEASGAAKAGTGRGSDPNARGGISPTPGSGGAGNAASGSPAAPGVAVSGGSSIVTLPSFGSDGSSSPAVGPGRSSVKDQQGPAITIQATSRSGGAFNYYDKLPGDNYTIYLDTSIGTVVMQYADPASSSHPYAGSLTSPTPLRADLPAGLPHSRLVVACVLDSSGNLKNLKVLEPGPAALTSQVLAALPNWKFRPAMRGRQPIEVNAILGFGIDTNDHIN